MVVRSLQDRIALLQVVIRQKFVLWMLKSPAHPPILMPKEFQSLIYILHFFGGE
jgi:hypothetical protein